MPIQDTPLFLNIYKLSIEFYKTNKRMPKRDRYLYGAKLENTCQDILENIIYATNATKDEKLPFLKTANKKLELLKIQLRMAGELKLISDKKYLEFENVLQEAGKMLGGWIRYQLR